MNLFKNRLFFSADDGGGNAETATAATTAEDDATQQQAEPVMVPQADVDRIVAKRLAAEKAKFDKQLVETVAKAKTQAQKLADLTAEERAKAEVENALKEREEKEADIERREREINMRELRTQALEALAEKGLSKSLLACVNMTDADTCNESIEALEKVLREGIKQGVDEHVKKHGYVPSKGSTNSMAELEAAFGLK